MALHENIDVHGRTWPHLADKATGRTLHLDPGGRSDVDTPPGFTDPFLKPVEPVDPINDVTPIPEPPVPDPANEE